MANQSGASAQLLLIPETFSDNQESWDFLVETVSDTVTPQISEYVKTYFGKTYLDPSFQVPKTRWDRTQMANYIRSVVRNKGKGVNPLHLSKIRSGDTVMIQHYKDALGKGYNYTIIDGNNRSTALLLFLTNKLRVTIPKVAENKFLKDMPTSFQSWFKALTVKVELHEAKSLEALSSSFETLNDGISLNAQEKRNAIIGKPARKVREISTSLSDKMAVFSWKGTTKKLVENDRRTMDEFIAQWLCRLNMAAAEQGSNINAGTLNTLYRADIPASVFRVLTEDVGTLESLFSSALANKDVDDDKIAGLTKSRLANLLLSIALLREQNLTISTNGLSVFFNWFLDSEEVRLGERPTDAHVKKACAHITDDFKRVKAMNDMKDDIYKEWSGRALNDSSKLAKRKAVIDRDLQAILPDWQSTGIVS